MGKRCGNKNAPTKATYFIKKHRSHVSGTRYRPDIQALEVQCRRLEKELCSLEGHNA